MGRKTTRTETVDDPEVPYVVEITLDLVGDADVVTAVTFRPRPLGPAINTDGIRDVPLGRLVREVTRRLSIDRMSSVPGTLRTAWRDLDHDVLLRLVADDYRAAVAWREAPTKQIAEGFRVSRATAGRWVADARAQGLIEIDAPNRPKE